MEGTAFPFLFSSINGAYVCLDISAPLSVCSMIFDADSDLVMHKTVVEVVAGHPDCDEGNSMLSLAFLLGMLYMVNIDVPKEWTTKTTMSKSIIPINWLFVAYYLVFLPLFEIASINSSTH